MKKIKIPKEARSRRIERAKKQIQKQQLKKIEAKYDTIINQTLELYKDKTWEELWSAFDVIKERMAKELEEIGIKK